MEKIVRGASDNFLRVSEFTEGFSATRQAYLVKCTHRLDINGSTFLTFYFKTADKATIVGRKFNVTSPNILEVIQKLNKSIVDITFTVQLFNGAYTLIVTDVSTRVADPSPFFNVFEGAANVTRYLNERALELGCAQLPNLYETSSLFSIDCGKVGGYLELLDYVYKIIIARQTSYTIELEKVFLLSVKPYFNYLTWLEVEQFVPKRTVLELVESIVGDDKVLNSIVSDTVMSLISDQKPEHLFSHIIHNAFKTANEQLRLESLVTTAPTGLVIQDKAGTLILY